MYKRQVYGTAPPRVATDDYKNPVAFAPWHPFHMSTRTIDLHGNFRRQLRSRTRAAQMNTLLHSRSAAWYTALHLQQRRHWPTCLPTGGAHLRIISRLRSGYAHIGDRLHWVTDNRCPSCGSEDSIQHMLLQCLGLVRARYDLLDSVRKVTNKTISVRLLLGFDGQLSSAKLRKITNATAKFVIAARRWP